MFGYVDLIIYPLTTTKGINDPKPRNFHRAIKGAGGQ